MATYTTHFKYSPPTMQESLNSFTRPTPSFRVNIAFRDVAHDVIIANGVACPLTFILALPIVTFQREHPDGILLERLQPSDVPLHQNSNPLGVMAIFSPSHQAPPVRMLDFHAEFFPYAFQSATFFRRNRVTHSLQALDGAAGNALAHLLTEFPGDGVVTEFAIHLPRPYHRKATRCNESEEGIALFKQGLYPQQMSVATLQQIGQDLPRWVALAQHGEVVAITQAGSIIARLMPPEATAASQPTKPRVEWPDFAARRRAIFGDEVLPAGTAQSLIDEDRGE